MNRQPKRVPEADLAALEQADAVTGVPLEKVMLRVGAGVGHSPLCDVRAAALIASPIPDGRAGLQL